MLTDTDTETDDTAGISVGRTLLPQLHPPTNLSQAARGMWRAETILVQARALLIDAYELGHPGDRFRIAHLAALRAAAALLLSVSPPGPRSARRPTSAWVLIERLAPDFGQWAAYFAAHAGRRAAADAGAVGVVGAAAAVEMLAAVETFLDLVEAAVTDVAVGRRGGTVLPTAYGPAQVPPPPRRVLSAAS